VLASAGCIEAWTAVSCEHALERIRAERLTPDLLVIDLAELPPDALAVLRRLRDTPTIAIVREADVEPALAAGAADVVTRPIRAAELHARITAALQLRSRRARRVSRTRVLSEEIRKLRDEKHELERLVCVDSLTGVANRRHALSLLQAEWARSAREGQPLAVVMLDIDEFHAYNAVYGHPGGDSCLRGAVGAMVGCLRRPSDFLGRYGGEEFVAVLACTDAAGARVVAERMRAAVEALQLPHAGSSCAAVVTVSAGFASMVPALDRTAGVLVEAADAALRWAKLIGRNCVVGEAPATAAAPAEISVADLDAGSAEGSAEGSAAGFAAGSTDELRWARHPAVTVDPSLVDRVPSFLASVREGACAIDQARRARDFERVRAVARRLKAAGRELDFDEVHRLAAEIERASRTPDREAIRRAAAELDHYVAHVRVVYRRQTTELAAVAAL